MFMGIYMQNDGMPMGFEAENEEILDFEWEIVEILEF